MSARTFIHRALDVIHIFALCCGRGRCRRMKELGGPGCDSREQQVALLF